jgi:hypothetical protein
MSTTTRKRTRPAHGHPRLPMYRVTIEAHDIPPRWRVPAQTIEVGASTAEIACRAVVRFAHRDAGVPPLRSMLALSLEHTIAKPARSPAMRSEMAA